VTLAWKISVHVAVVSGALAVLLLVFGPTALALAPLVPLVAWARTQLGDHTLGQTIGGFCLGAAAAICVRTAPCVPLGAPKGIPTGSG
jgi:membrane-associated phospholipid phosphatase